MIWKPLKLAAAALLAFAWFVSAGCKPDSAGNSSTTSPASTAAATGPRIVSTVPAATFNLMLIGSAADRLVGVSRYDKGYLPQNLQNLPVVGDYETLDMELLLKLKPTSLIIQMAESRIPQTLRDRAAAAHFELVNVRFDTIEGIWKNARTLGRIANCPEQAESAIARAQFRLKEITDTYAITGRPKPKVLYIIARQGLEVAGGESILNEMIQLAGGENLGATVGVGFPSVSREAIAKLAPEVLLVGAPSETDQVQNDPRIDLWMQLPIPAAANKRIFLVVGPNSQMASLNIAESVQELATLIHKGELLAGGGK